MEELLEEIVKLLPEIDDYREEFERLKQAFERSIQELFDIEDLESLEKEVSKKDKDKTDKTDKTDKEENDLSSNSTDEHSDVSSNTDEHSDLSDNEETRYSMIVYYNPFSFLYDTREKKPKGQTVDFQKKIRFYYRRIILYCHPDKCKKSRMKRKFNFKESRDIIHKAKSAYRKSQYGVLLYLAYSVGIAIHRLSPCELEYVEGERDNLSGIVKEILSSFPWIWHHQPWNRPQIINYLKKNHRLTEKKKS